MFRYVLLHESACRVRFCAGKLRISMDEADILEYYLKSLPFVKSASVDERTGNATVYLRKSTDVKNRLFSALDQFSFEKEELIALVPENGGRKMNRIYEDRLFFLTLGKGFRNVFFPVPLEVAWTAVKSIRFIARGLESLLKGRIEVSLLDAAAIIVSMLRNDFATAGSVMFLLDVGELLEEWTYRKSVADLAGSMSLKIEKVWLRKGEEDILTPIKEIQAGDRIVVRTSGIIPLDGITVAGHAMVNQSSMTGESVPVEKKPGTAVYAGTIIEEGECVIEVTKTAGTGKYDQIVRMIEDSEKLKSVTEERAFHLADRLVPYSLGGTVLTWLLTRNANQALAFLMVDFSCALKLSMPLSVLSAIREAGTGDMTVKGGKFLEAVAQADTIIFDKTGTLTHAEPRVAKIIPFGNLDETQILRIAACLEEHYPHSMASAVVNEAKKRGIVHDEMHSEVQYIVAHGISSMIDGKKVLIGSRHFIFEDEKCTVAKNRQKKLDRLPESYSHLYLAIGGKLQAVICIFDPLRKEAPLVIKELRKLGFGKICMMTGDNEKTAAKIAEMLDLDLFRAEVLPADKAAFVRAEHAAGRKVIMVGDGINDAPALAEADAGIAISDGAAIAREVADIIITADDLTRLIYLRRLSLAMMDRIGANYRFIMGFNGLLIALGVLGVLQPAASALLHNTSTLVSGLRSMMSYLPDEEEWIQSQNKRKKEGGTYEMA